MMLCGIKILFSSVCKMDLLPNDEARKELCRSFYTDPIKTFIPPHIIVFFV